MRARSPRSTTKNMRVRAKHISSTSNTVTATLKRKGRQRNTQKKHYCHESNNLNKPNETIRTRIQRQKFLGTARTRHSVCQPCSRVCKSRREDPPGKPHNQTWSLLGSRRSEHICKTSAPATETHPTHWLRFPVASSRAGPQWSGE